MQEDRRAFWQLKKIPLVKGLPREDLTRLAAGAKITEIRRRRVIYMPGDPGDSVMFICTGRVKVSRVTSDGKELTLAYRTAGDLFGEICMLDGSSREEMAETTDNCVLLVVPRENLNEVIAGNADLGAAMTRMLLQRRRDLERKIEDLVFKDVNAKLAELLLKLSTPHGVKHEHGTLLNLKITHQEMANLIGSTRETVSLALSQFKRKKLITSESRRVILMDIEGLRAYV